MVSRSAVESAKAVGRLMPNDGGPLAAKRRFLSSVVLSRSLYAAPVWASSAVPYQMNRIVMVRAQRQVALRIMRCYRKVSAMAALVISELPPTDLLAKERAHIRRRRGEDPSPTRASLVS